MSCGTQQIWGRPTHLILISFIYLGTSSQRVPLRRLVPVKAQFLKILGKTFLKKKKYNKNRLFSS